MGKKEHKIGYLSEAIMLLWCLGGEDTYEKQRKQMSEKMPLSDMGNRIFDLIIKVKNEALKRLSAYTEDVKFYFGFENESHDCPGGVALLWEKFTLFDTHSYSSLKEEILSMSEEKYLKNIYNRIENYNRIIFDTNEPKQDISLADVINLILGLDISDNEKVKLQDIVVNREKHLNKIEPLFDIVTEVIKDNEAAITEILEDRYNFWEKETKEKGAVAYFSEIFAADFGAPKFGSSVRIFFFTPNHLGASVELNEDTGAVESEYVINIGSIYGADFMPQEYIAAERSLSGEHAMKMLKGISDPTKFAILSIIKEKPTYGSDLAKRLNLTTATISYHTNELYELGLLSLEKQGNKTFYSTNKGNLEKLVKYVSTTLV